MVSDKIKALLKLTGKREVELAEYYGMSAQGMHNKISRGSFSSDDLIKISDFVGAELAYTLPGGQKITFDTKDIRKSRSTI